jgi:NADH-quinone oxidoreductase subunit E
MTHPDTVARIVSRYPDAHRDSLIPILQEVQEADGYLSRETIIGIAQRLSLPASKVFGVATFYNQFRFQPKGRHHIQVCRGTACHVKGSAGVLESIQRALEIMPGQTTRDGLFSLEVVACIGACGLSPAITVNGEVHAAMTPDRTKKLIASHIKEADQNGPRD